MTLGMTLLSAQLLMQIVAAIYAPLARRKPAE
jgi:hypothetical protein